MTITNQEITAVMRVAARGASLKHIRPLALAKGALVPEAANEAYADHIATAVREKLITPFERRIAELEAVIAERDELLAELEELTADPLANGVGRPS